MRIKKVKFKNIKSFKNRTEIPLNMDVNIFIGPNAGGKSNMLEIIQSFFNDLLLEQINISDDNNEPREKPFKIESASSNKENAIKDIFDKFVGHEDENQEVSVFLEIESEDIENIKSFKSISGELVNFEEKFFKGTTIQNFINEINLDSPFENLINQTMEIKFNNHSLVEPSNVEEKPFKDFFKFLKFSSAFFHFCNFYNNESEDADFAEFKPYFLYFPPGRQHINLGRTQVVELSGGSDYNRHFFRQTNTSQYQPLDTWSYLTWVLVYNYHSEQTQKNEPFRQLLRGLVGVDYSIKKMPPKTKNKYEIEFYRTVNNTSPKLSSGEDEMVSFVSTLFVHNISNGICVIDEPELHLHPRWQKKIVKLFEQMADERNLQFIMATHSPQFVSSNNLEHLFRVYKNTDSGSSEVEIADKEGVEEANIKHVTKALNATNNEKAFFSDKVVLVEGIVDRIIFEAILKKQEGEHNQIIEVVDVSGKHEFEKYEEIMSLWNIPVYIIADFDYIKQLNRELYEKIKVVNIKKLEKALGEKSKDTKKLSELVLKITKKELDELGQDEFSSLKSLCIYLVDRQSSLPESLDEEVQKELYDFIKGKHDEGVFILKEGEIEKYFENGGKFDIEDAIQLASKIEDGTLTIPSELENIIKEITD